MSDYNKLLGLCLKKILGYISFFHGYVLREFDHIPLQSESNYYCNISDFDPHKTMHKLHKYFKEFFKYLDDVKLELNKYLHTTGLSAQKTLEAKLSSRILFKRLTTLGQLEKVKKLMRLLEQPVNNQRAALMTTLENLAAQWGQDGNSWRAESISQQYDFMWGLHTVLKNLYKDLIHNQIIQLLEINNLIMDKDISKFFSSFAKTKLFARMLYEFTPPLREPTIVVNEKQITNKILFASERFLDLHKNSDGISRQKNHIRLLVKEKRVDITKTSREMFIFFKKLFDDLEKKNAEYERSHSERVDAIFSFMHKKNILNRLKNQPSTNVIIKNLIYFDTYTQFSLDENFLPTSIDNQMGELLYCDKQPSYDEALLKLFELEHSLFTMFLLKMNKIQALHSKLNFNFSSLSDITKFPKISLTVASDPFSEDYRGTTLYAAACEPTPKLYDSNDINNIHRLFAPSNNNEQPVTAKNEAATWVAVI